MTTQAPPLRQSWEISKVYTPKFRTNSFNVLKHKGFWENPTAKK